MISTEIAPSPIGFVRFSVNGHVPDGYTFFSLANITVCVTFRQYSPSWKTIRTDSYEFHGFGYATRLICYDCEGTIFRWKRSTFLNRRAGESDGIERVYSEFSSGRFKGPGPPKDTQGRYTITVVMDTYKAYGRENAIFGVGLSDGDKISETINSLVRNKIDCEKLFR